MNSSLLNRYMQPVETFVCNIAQKKKDRKRIKFGHHKTYRRVAKTDIAYMLDYVNVYRCETASMLCASPF